MSKEVKFVFEDKPGACGKCGISVMIRPLQRVNSMGETGVFWCEFCIKCHEPELYKNIMEEESDVEKELKKMFYGKK